MTSSSASPAGRTSTAVRATAVLGATHSPAVPPGNQRRTRRAEVGIAENHGKNKIKYAVNVRNSAGHASVPFTNCNNRKGLEKGSHLESNYLPVLQLSYVGPEEHLQVLAPDEGLRIPLQGSSAGPEAKQCAEFN